MKFVAILFSLAVLATAAPQSQYLYDDYSSNDLSINDQLIRIRRSFTPGQMAEIHDLLCPDKCIDFGMEKKDIQRFVMKTVISCSKKIPPSVRTKMNELLTKVLDNLRMMRSKLASMDVPSFPTFQDIKNIMDEYPEMNKENMKMAAVRIIGLMFPNFDLDAKIEEASMKKDEVISLLSSLKPDLEAFHRCMLQSVDLNPTEISPQGIKKAVTDKCKMITTQKLPGNHIKSIKCKCHNELVATYGDSEDAGITKDKIKMFMKCVGKEMINQCNGTHGLLAAMMASAPMKDDTKCQDVQMAPENVHEYNTLVSNCLAENPGRKAEEMELPTFIISKIESNEGSNKANKIKKNMKNVSGPIMVLSGLMQYYYEIQSCVEVKRNLLTIENGKMMMYPQKSIDYLKNKNMANWTDETKTQLLDAFSDCIGTDPIQLMAGDKISSSSKEDFRQYVKFMIQYTSCSLPKYSEICSLKSDLMKAMTNPMCYSGRMKNIVDKFMAAQDLNQQMFKNPEKAKEILLMKMDKLISRVSRMSRN